MKRERHVASQRTFADRAAAYDGESTWVRDSRLIDPLLEALPDGSTVLDVCCGTGTVGGRAQQLGHGVISVDLSQDMLLQNRLPARVRSSSSALPFRARAVHRLLCRQGLHYLELPRAFAEWSRVAITDIAVGTITMLAESDRPFWRTYFADASPGRLHIFAPGDLRAAAESLGLTVLSELVVEDRGSLLGPVRHLPSSTQDELRAAFLRPEVATKYDVQFDGNDLTYTQRWEFLRLALE